VANGYDNPQYSPPNNIAAELRYPQRVEDNSWLLETPSNAATYITAIGTPPSALNTPVNTATCPNCNAFAVRCEVDVVSYPQRPLLEYSPKRSYKGSFSPARRRRHGVMAKLGGCNV